MNRYPVIQDPETLNEYRDELQSQRQVIEELALALESTPDELPKVVALREIFQQLWLSSTKLELVPVGENLEILVKAFDFMLEHCHYPVSFSDFLLLFLDNLVLISEDVLEHRSIDMLAVQNVHIALQDVNLATTPQQLKEGVNVAIEHIGKIKFAGIADASSNDDIMLFDDDEADDSDITLFGDDEPDDSGITLFDDEDDSSQPVATQSHINKASLEHFVPDASINPINEAREYMLSKASDPINLLAEMSDRLTSHGNRHTMYLQEIALATNIMLGEPVDPEDLWLGLALHDIGLAPMTDIVDSSEALTADELSQFKEHPIKGAMLAKRMGITGGALLVIEQHHERVDGTGYPYGLKDGDISYEGRIAAVADAFHSMIANRPDQGPARRSLMQVISEIKGNSGKKFDPNVVKAFLDCLLKYWIPRHVLKVDDDDISIDFEV